MDENAIRARIEVLLAVPWENRKMYSLSSQILQGAITLLEAVHGTDAEQTKVLNARVATIERSETSGVLAAYGIFEAATGTLLNLKGELESGLTGSLNRTITGEVLSDFLALAKEAVDRGDENGKNGKNVAAVLTAAAFEDTIRRMGTSFCGIHERDKLEKIVIALKERGILVGSQFGTVQAQLQFRNDALHADWNKIDVVGVRTVLELVQALLLKHFS